MACGAPVIVGEGNALTEVVGEAGIAFAPRDHEALARQMTRVITDPDLWLRMSESGVRRAASFSWDSAARTLIRVLEEAGRS
jgi:glycosyltransferase involved in cell wall biosynthesis